MTYEQQLQQAHKERVNRMYSAGVVDVPLNLKKNWSKTAQEKKDVKEKPLREEERLIFELRQRNEFLEAEIRRLMATYSQESDAAPKYPSLLQIKNAVADAYGIPAIEIEKQSRHKNVVEPRHVTIHLARRLTLLSYPAMGRKLGNRDHTSLMYADRKVSERRQAEPAFDAKIAELERLLRVE